jgi:hypothetical protein
MPRHAVRRRHVRSRCAIGLHSRVDDRPNTPRQPAHADERKMVVRGQSAVWKASILSDRYKDSALRPTTTLFNFMRVINACLHPERQQFIIVPQARRLRKDGHMMVTDD